MNRDPLLSIALFGAIMLTFGLFLGGHAHTPAYAGTADSGAGVVAVTGLSSSNQEVLYLYDSESRRLAVYKVDASNRLALLAARDTTFDLKPQEYGKQDPSVKEMREAWKKHETDRPEPVTAGREK